MIETDYISFDLFDTLLARNVKKPTDIFYLIEEKYNQNHNKKINNFKEIRINAERIAREKSSYDEITFDAIYNEVRKLLTDVDIEKLKGLEEEIEYDLITRNNNSVVFNMYEYAKKNNKKIILISDMYLPKKFVEKLLIKCNITYYKLYLSSELRINKHTGKIFKYVLQDLNIKSNQLIHLGDNKKSDYISPMRNGIKAILVKNECQLRYSYSQKDYDIYYDMLISVLKNYYDDTQSYFFNFGYECLGPILLSFSMWLNTNFKKNKIKKVYFLARDGKIMKDAFDLFYNNYESYYLFGSRRSLIVPSLWKYKDISEIFDSMFLPKEIKLSRLLEQLGVDEYNLNNYLEQNNMESEKIYKLTELKTIYLPFFKSIYHIIIENSKNEYNNLLNYLDKNNFKNKLAIVDIGWFGNMQKAIELNIKNVDIYGYYLGIIPDSQNQNKYKMKGFLFEKNKNAQLYDMEHYFNSILEFIFSTNHGSVKKFKEKDVEFYNYEYESSYEDEQLQEIQNGAKYFLNKIRNHNLQNYLKLSNVSAFQNILNFALNPSLQDSINFGNIKFAGNEHPYIAKPKAFKYYLLHPKMLMIDFRNAKWRIGFCKRVFKINLPYYKINQAIRHYYLEREVKR